MSDRARLPKEVKKASSNADLRNQLSDLQSRLVNARSHNSATEGRRAPQPDVAQHVQKPPSSQVPTPKSAAPSRIDFLVGVSDGLLAECRKLTAENSKLKQITNEQKEEFLAMSSKISNLTDLNSKLLREEEASKESNWELETKLQALSRDMAKTKADLAKAVRSNSNENSQNSELKAELESEKLKSAGLSENLATTSTKLKQECVSLKQQNEDLNNENDTLHAKLSHTEEKLSDLHKTISEAQTVHPRSKREDDLLGEIDSSDLLTDDESQTNDRNVLSSNFPLEKESLEASLMHANKTIAKLKKSVLKHKIANEELERKVLASDSFKTTSTNSPSSRSSAFFFHSNKNKRPRTPRGLSSQRTSQISSYYEDPSSLTNEDWENFEENLLAPTGEVGEATPASAPGGKLLSDEINHDSDLSDASDSSDSVLPSGVTPCARCSKIEDETYLKQLCENKGLVLLSEGEYTALNSRKELAPHSVILEDQDAQTWESLKHSPVTFIGRVAKEHDHHLVDATEYSKLVHPTHDVLSKHAESLDSKLVSVEEYSSLVKAAENPSREVLAQKAENLNCFLIDKQYPSVDDVNDLTSKLGMIPLKQTAYESLIDRLKYPTKDYLATACREKFGLAVIEQSTLDELQTKLDFPSKEYLMLKAKEMSQVILSNDRYSEMQDAIKEPSQEYLTRKADAHGLLIVPQQEHRDLLNSLKQPSLEHLKEMVKQNNHIALTTENYRQLIGDQKEYRLLLRKTQSPPQDYLVEKASLFGMTMIDDHELHELRNPSPKRVSELAFAIDSTLLNNFEYESLQNSQEELKVLGIKYQKLENDLELVTSLKNELSKTSEQLSKENTDLLARIDSLQASLTEKMLAFNAQTEKVRSLEQNYSSLAENHENLKKERDQISVLHNEITDAHRELLLSHESLENDFNQTKVHFSELCTMSEKPSKEYVIEKANAMGLVSLPQEELTEMNEKLTKPSEDYLSEKAKSLFGNILVSKNSFEELLVKADQLSESLENPSQTFIQDKATVLGLTAVDSLVYNDMKSELENPSEEFMHMKARKAGLVVLEKAKYVSLLSRLSHPNAEYLEEKCSALNMVPINNEHFAELEAFKNEPSLEFIKEKASSMGYAVIKDGEWKALETQTVKLQESIGAPSLEYLTEKAKNHDRLLISCEEHNQLELAVSSPSYDWLQSASMKLGYTMVTLEDYDTLKRAHESPTMEFLESRAAEQGYALEKVQEKSSDLTLESLKETARSFGYVLMTSAEVASSQHDRALEHPNETDFSVVGERAEKGVALKHEGPERNFSDVSDMATESDLSVESLRAQAEARSLMLLPLLVMPSLQKLFSRVEDPVSVDEKVNELIELASFDKVKASRNEKLCASLELLFEQNRELLKDCEMPAFFENLCDRYKKLLYNVESPSVDYLSKMAKMYQCIVVDQASYDELVNLTSTEAGLRDNANNLGFVVSRQADYDRMKAFSDTPTAGQLAEKAQTLSLRLVEEDKMLLEESTVADIAVKLEKMGYFVVDDNDWQILRNPGLQHMKPKLETLGFAVLPSAELSTLVTQSKEVQQAIDSPELDYLERKLADLGYASVLKSSWEDMQSQALEPSLAHLRSKAEKFGCIVVEQSAYDDLVSKIENPSFDYISNHLGTKDMKPVLYSEYSDLHSKAFSPDVAHVSKMAENIGMLTLSKEEHSRLVNESFNPSRQVIFDSAPKMGLTVISREDHDELLRPMSIEELEASAEKMGYVMTSVAAFENLTFKAGQSVKEKAAAEGFDLIEPSLLESLNRSAAESLEYKASCVDKVLMSESDYATSLKTAEDLRSLEKQYQTVCQKHANPSEDELRELAEKFGLHIVPVEELSSLKDERQKAMDALNVSRQSMEQPDVIKAKAKALGFTLVEHDIYDKLVDENALTLEERASQKHMTLLTSEEFGQLVRKAEASLQQKAESAGMAVLPKSEYEQLTRQISSPTKAFLTEKLSAYNLECEDVTRLKTLQSIEQNPSMDFLTSHASRQGNVIVASQEFDSLKSQAASGVEKIGELSNVNSQLASSHRFLTEDVEKLKSRLADPSCVRAAAESLNMKVMTLEEFEAQSTKTVDDLREIAGGLGYDLIPRTHTLSTLSFHDSKSVVSMSDYEDAMSHFSTSKDDLNSTKDDLDEEALRRQAEVMGFNLVPTGIDTEDTDDDSTMDEASIATVEHSITQEQAERFAQSNGLKLVSASEFEGLVNATAEDTGMREIRSADDVRSAADELGLCVIGKSKLQELEAHTSLSNADVVSLSTRLGLLCIPESSFVATNVCRTPTSENVVVLPKTFFTKLAKSHEFIKEATKKGFTLAPVSDAVQTDARSLEGSQGLAPAAVISDSYSLPSRSSVGATGSTIASMGGPLSPARSFRTEISMATNVSLTDKNMIPVITQTIIGEYLFKYYRRLGPLSAISENRHERYFWIHPYSLTLYWSMANPVLGDPAENKIRGAAIIGVESVEDNNPLPPGLHHRSILVHCNDRTIKITCPTRQRHNIWYNSIRYLIQRTTEGISFDDTHENIGSEQQYHETLTDEEKAQIERSSSYRHIRPRRSVLRSQSKMFGNPPRSS